VLSVQTSTFQTSDGDCKIPDLLVKAIENINTVVRKDLQSLMLADDFSSRSDGFDPTPRTFPESPQSQPMKQQPRGRQRDSLLVERAQELGLNLERFEGAGLEEQAIKELNAMVENSKEKGFLSVIRKAANESSVMGLNESDVKIDDIFRIGASKATKSVEEMLARPNPYDDEDVREPSVHFPINLSAAGLEKGIDIFEGPNIVGSIATSSLDGQEQTARGLNKQYDHISPVNQATLDKDEKRLRMLVKVLPLVL
jgi:hypothetical protein